MAAYIVLFAIPALLAIVGNYLPQRFLNAVAVVVIYAAALFSGLRQNVGPDTVDYISYFEDLGFDGPSFDGFDLQRFEIGFYTLASTVKWAGGSVNALFLIVSLLLAYSFSSLVSKLNINRAYAVTIYIGYSYLVLSFSQIRQAVSIAFLLLAICGYLSGRARNISVLLLAAVGIAFQYSAIIYVILLALAIYWPKEQRFKWSVLAALGILLVGAAVSRYSDFFSVLALIGNASASHKLELYKELQVDQGSGNLTGYAVYLAGLAIYLMLFRGGRGESTRFLSDFAALSLMLTVLMVFVFSGSYVMYSRVYLAAGILQAVSLAITFQVRRGFFHQSLFFLSIFVSGFYYYRILTINESDYSPYNSVVRLLW